MNRYLNDVKAEHAFVLSGGRQLKNLTELKRALFTMDQATFHHHVHDGKNDFAAWVNDCIKDTYLAEKINATTSKDHMAKVVAERTNELSHQRSPGAHLPKGPLDDPLATDHIVQEIEMLSKGFSTERVLANIKSQNIVTNIGSRIMAEPDIKESDAGIVVLRKQGKALATTVTNRSLPLFDIDHQLTNTPLSFFEKLNLLMHSIEAKDRDKARSLYSELKSHYEQASFSPGDKRAVHGILREAYDDILKI